MNEEQKAFQLIKDRYFQLDKNFDNLNAMCESDIQKQELRENYRKARINYKKTMNKAFDDNTAKVKKLTQKLEEAETKLNKALEVKGNMEAVLKALSTSVEIANTIAGIIL